MGPVEWCWAGLVLVGAAYVWAVHAWAGRIHEDSQQAVNQLQVVQQSLVTVNARMGDIVRSFDRLEKRALTVTRAQVEAAARSMYTEDWDRAKPSVKEALIACMRKAFNAAGMAVDPE